MNEDDASMLQSLQDDSAIDSDSEDVCNESYEVFLIIFSHCLGLYSYFRVRFYTSKSEIVSNRHIQNYVKLSRNNKITSLPKVIWQEGRVMAL